MMPPFVVFPTNRIAHFVEVSLYLFYLAQRVNYIVTTDRGHHSLLNRKSLFIAFYKTVKKRIMEHNI